MGEPLGLSGLKDKLLLIGCPTSISVRSGVKLPTLVYALSAAGGLLGGFTPILSAEPGVAPLDSVESADTCELVDRVLLVRASCTIDNVLGASCCCKFMRLLSLCERLEVLAADTAQDPTLWVSSSPNKNPRPPVGVLWDAGGGEHCPGSCNFKLLTELLLGR